MILIFCHGRTYHPRAFADVVECTGAGVATCHDFAGIHAVVPCNTSMICLARMPATGMLRGFNTFPCLHHAMVGDQLAAFPHAKVICSLADTSLRAVFSPEFTRDSNAIQTKYQYFLRSATIA